MWLGTRNAKDRGLPYVTDRIAMTRRSRPVGLLFALLVAGSSIVSSNPRDLALAADPLTEARAEQQALEQALERQRAELDALQASAAQLSDQLDVAEAELSSVTAEYDRVNGLLAQVKDQVSVIQAHLASLRDQIAELDARLQALALEIAEQTRELRLREELLQEHVRSAYEYSQTSLLEVLLSADSLDAAANQVSYLLTIAEQDRDLGDQIRRLRDELNIREASLREGRAALAEARTQAQAEEAALIERQTELAIMEQDLERLRAAAQEKRAAQAATLNAALDAQGNVEATIAANEAAFAAANELVAKLEAEEAARLAAGGWRWPEDVFHVTQEWGPTNFRLEPPYTYNGVYYPHFHGGIDLANGCGTPIKAIHAGKVVASGQPLWPWDSAYGVGISHGGGISSWYWHLRAQVIVFPGQQVSAGDVIGYEGTTGHSTGCHLHLSVNDHGVWENPRNYLP